MKNEQLEQALFFAGEANDIASLKSLARQESGRADQMVQLLAAVLTATGPIRLHQSAIRRDGSFTVIPRDYEGMMVLAAAVPTRPQQMLNMDFPNGMTVADLKAMVRDWPETDERDEPCEVWLWCPERNRT